MKHSSRQHLLHTVLPLAEQFAEFYRSRNFGNRQDSKNACILAGSLRDMADHVYIEIGGHLKTFGITNEKLYRESFWNEVPGYRLTCNLADVWKHRELKRKDRILNSVDDIKESHIVIRYTDSNGHYYGTHKTLMIQTIDGTLQEASRPLFNSVLLWVHEMKRQSLIGKIPITPVPHNWYQSREECNSSCPMNIEIHTDENFAIEQQTFIFDNSISRLRPATKADEFSARFNMQLNASLSPIQA